MDKYKSELDNINKTNILDLKCPLCNNYFSLPVMNIVSLYETDDISILKKTIIYYSQQVEELKKENEECKVKIDKLKYIIKLKL